MTARTLLACFLAAVLPSACVQTTYERFDATPAVAAEAPKVLWEKTFVGSAKSIAVLPDGGLAVAGYTKFKSAGRFDAWVLRFDSDGRRLWDRTAGGKLSDDANAIAVLPDGGLVVAGSLTLESRYQDAWVRRFDGDGRLLWERTAGGSHDDEANAIAVHPDGGLVVAGRNKIISAGKGWWDPWVRRLDDGGRLLWEKTFDRVQGGYAFGTIAVAVLPDGGLAVVDTSALRRDHWVLRLESEAAVAARGGSKAP